MITAQRHTEVPTAPPSPPRLVLPSTRSEQAILDGGWWPLSWDPVGELPGLVLALSDRYGPIRQLMLNADTWGGRFRRLAMGSRTVRIGWFTSLDPALAIATTDSGVQIDLLVVPPATPDAVARRAMAAAAAGPANTIRASGVLAAASAASSPTPNGSADSASVWDNEGGHVIDAPISDGATGPGLSALPDRPRRVHAGGERRPR